MAVQLETTIQRFRGLSADIKPGRDLPLDAADEIFETPPVGSIFTEVDTGARFVWTGSWPWVRQDQTIEPLLNRLIEVNSQMLQTLAAIQRGHEEHLWENEVEPI